MANNIYNLIKRVIASGQYDKDDMLNKINTYEKYGRLTTEEAEELREMLEEE